MKSEKGENISLKVVEIFHSIQGEGANTGKSAIFVRLANCNKNCWYCDTDWRFGTDMTVNQILEEVKRLALPSEEEEEHLLIWTGGEPTLQLTDEVLEHFNGYFNCIETNGSNKVPSKIKYISCSPKVSTSVLRENFDFVNEFRYPASSESTIPSISELPKADNYFISPIFMGDERKRFEMDKTNIEFCIDFVKKNPQWRISLQTHKLLNIR